MSNNAVMTCRVLRGVPDKRPESARFTWYTEDIWGVTIGFRVVRDPEHRVLCGASWFNVPDPMIAAFRSFNLDWNGYYGFRVVRDE